MSSVSFDRPRPVESRASDFATWGPTHLRVRDLDEALRFWNRLLGLQVLRVEPDAVALGVEDAELIVLHAGARQPSPRGHAGLYHVALHLPSAQDFTEMFDRLASRGVDPRPTDHLMHWAMYLFDADDIGVELSFETVDRFDHVIPGRRPILVGADGSEQGISEPLDMRPLLDAFPASHTNRPMPAGTRVGHNHLHVGDLAAATRFYERLGFAVNSAFMGMCDFNAGGSFLHRLAINEWAGYGAPPSPPDAAGLDHMELVVTDGGALRRALDALNRDGVVVAVGGRPGVRVADPSGNAIALTAVEA